MDNINMLVEDMIKKHKGGEKFFDNLDENLRNKNYFETLFKKFAIETNSRHFIPITSGKFGLYFSQFLKEKDIFSLNVNGGLRKGEKIISLEPFKNHIKDANFVFFDDSFYKGRTRDAIKNELEKFGGKLVETYVCYDGSKIKENSVFSLYRYY